MSDTLKIGLCITGGVLVIAGVVTGFILVNKKKSED